MGKSKYMVYILCTLNALLLMLCVLCSSARSSISNVYTQDVHRSKFKWCDGDTSIVENRYRNEKKKKTSFRSRKHICNFHFHNSHFITLILCENEWRKGRTLHNWYALMRRCKIARWDFALQCIAVSAVSITIIGIIIIIENAVVAGKWCCSFNICYFQWA